MKEDNRPRRGEKGRKTFLSDFSSDFLVDFSAKPIMYGDALRAEPTVDVRSGSQIFQNQFIILQNLTPFPPCTEGANTPFLLNSLETHRPG